MSAWTYRAVDPSTGVASPPLPTATAADVDRAVSRAHATFERLRRTPVLERAALARALAPALRARADELARLMAAEMGKPLADGKAEIEKCAVTCEYVAEHGPRWLAAEVLPSDASSSWVQYDPLGVVFAIMPWNFPFWQYIRFAAPALVAGNSFLLKHAPCTPGCGEALEALFAEVGVDAPNVRLGPDQIERVIADPRVAAVTLTGSTAAGRAVATLAGRHLKRSVLELGGSDPFVVLADADVAVAARTAARSRLVNGGQSCISAKRFVVVRSVADAFVEQLTAALQAYVVGPPTEPAVTVGPMARADLREGLHDQVIRSLAAGARLVLGGQPLPGPGNFYPVTLLLDVGPGMACWDEELFGPVACVRVVDDEDEAFLAASEGPYGLGASVWSAAPERLAGRLATMSAGCVFVNGMVKSDVRLPFGGTGDSGWGKELGPHGLRELTLSRTVWVA
jgi:succinate-semialdehyde dehydrogenase/glutarate-semialdehyde dehydrogenase